MPPSPMRDRMRYGPTCSGIAASAYWLGQSLGATLDEPIALPGPPMESVGGPLSSVSADGFTSADDALGVSGSDMRCVFQLNEPPRASGYSGLPQTTPPTYRAQQCYASRTNARVWNEGRKVGKVGLFRCHAA